MGLLTTSAPAFGELVKEEVQALYWLSLEPKFEILRKESKVALNQLERENILSRSLLVVSEVVVEVEQLATSGVLKHLFDFASVLLSTLTLFVRDVIVPSSTRHC